MLPIKIITSYITNTSHAQVLANIVKPTESQKIEIDKIYQRYLLGEPLAYIFGEKEFYGRNFIVDKNTLVPRPETECLIDLVVPQVKKGDRIADIGAGSGAIGLTLAMEMNDTIIELVEPNLQTLEIAKVNAKKFNLSGNRIIFTHSTEPIVPPDIIVSNPPYLTKAEYEKNLHELSFEPYESLVADMNGMAVIYQVLQTFNESKARLLIMEMTDYQGELLLHEGYKGKIKRLMGTNVIAFIIKKNYS